MTQAAFMDRSCRVIAIVTVGLLSGCPSADPDAPGLETDTDIGGDPEQLPGVRVECCYQLGVVTPGTAPQYEQGCTVPNQSICVDPSDRRVDTNLDGTLDEPELVAVCAGKCPPESELPFWGVPFVDEDGLPLEIRPPYDVCQAVGGTVDATANPCDPSAPGHLEPWPSSTVPPTHSGTFTSRNEDTGASVTVNGDTRAIDFEGSIAFAITDCAAYSVGETCRLDLQELQLNLVGTPKFGDYRVEKASIDLGISSSTSVSFTCGGAKCYGRFKFAADVGTAVQANLNWEQTTLSTGSSGVGSLPLGDAALGELAWIIGELHLDATKTQGTLRLRGQGRDNFGGDFASVGFDLVGSVGAYQL